MRRERSAAQCPERPHRGRDAHPHRLHAPGPWTPRPPLVSVAACRWEGGWATSGRTFVHRVVSELRIFAREREHGKEQVDAHAGGSSTSCVFLGGCSPKLKSRLLPKGGSTERLQALHGHRSGHRGPAPVDRGCHGACPFQGSPPLAVGAGVGALSPALGQPASCVFSHRRRVAAAGSASGSASMSMDISTPSRRRRRSLAMGSRRAPSMPRQVVRAVEQRQRPLGGTALPRRLAESAPSSDARALERLVARPGRGRA